MKIYINILCFFVLVSGSAFSQAAANFLNRDYKFQDGLYLTYSAFQSDTPDHPIGQLEGRLVTNDETGLTKSDYLAFKRDSSAVEIDLTRVWGICLDGVPYIRLTGKGEEAGFATFAKLKVRGAICYFTFETDEPKYVEVKAYNPLNGKPFRRAKVRNMERVDNKMMLRFDTGEVRIFNRDNLLAWVQEDAQLTQAIREIGSDKEEEQLYRSILIYDDRHPVYINRQ
ncbi:MAG: hypothetical protein R2824_05630 [Saprospiraceae bacterium]|nr:hypothetical protein [Lewinella sp.]